MSQQDAPSPPEDRSAVARIATIVARIVDVATSRPRWVIALALVLGACSTFYVIENFEMRTDLDALLSDKLEWRAESNRVERDFPSQGDDIVVVVDGDTPESAERAATLLTTALSKRTDLFASVRRANGGAFWAKSGLLFLPRADVEAITSGLIKAQPFLGPLAADPSLRGLATSIDTALQDNSDPQSRLQQLERPLRAITDTLARTQAGRPGLMSWRGIIREDAGVQEDRRQFIEILPKLDYSDFMPAARHTTTIRQAARALELIPERGVRVRITGSAPIADDELLTLQESVGPIGLLMLAGMLAILFLAVRSPGIVFSIATTVAIGAAASSALGLLIFHRFNLISVAFLPLFVGLGIDFAIQFCVRVRAEIKPGVAVRVALISAGEAVGGGIVLAVAATIAGFFAFLPTNYRGVSELGLVAGLGMVIALALTTTLLPALLTLLLRGGGAPETGLPWLRGADDTLRRSRWLILGTTAVLAVAAIGALPSLRFDFDPMSLRSSKTESLALYRDLERSVETTPNTLNVVAPNPAAAHALSIRLNDRAEIARTVTIESFIPNDQDAKLISIRDARDLLDLTLNPFDVAGPPSDADLASHLAGAASSLRSAAAKAPKDGATAQSLAQAFDALARATPHDRARAQDALMGGFPTALTQINDMLSAEPVTIDTLPADLQRDWSTPSGATRIEVLPKKPLRVPKDIATFVAAARQVAPQVSGDAVTVVESGRTILAAFAQAGVLSTIAIIALLLVTLRSAFWTTMAIAPVLLSGLLTFATCAITAQPINLENMIALPLLLGIGVAFNIYFIVARRAGVLDLIQSSLARAIVFSALTTGAAFAALALSAHPGTASMGTLLLVALFWILATTLVFLPALLSVAVPTTDPAQAMP